MEKEGQYYLQFLWFAASQILQTPALPCSQGPATVRDSAISDLLHVCKMGRALRRVLEEKNRDPRTPTVGHPGCNFQGGMRWIVCPHLAPMRYKTLDYFCWILPCRGTTEQSLVGFSFPAKNGALLCEGTGQKNSVVWYTRKLKRSHLCHSNYVSISVKFNPSTLWILPTECICGFRMILTFTGWSLQMETQCFLWGTNFFILIRLTYRLVTHIFDDFSPLVPLYFHLPPPIHRY
jgi:hypothetical protein